MFNKVSELIWPDTNFEEGENIVMCPFHGDTRASAHVKLENGHLLFHCKACDLGHNDLTLLADYYNTENKYAAKLLNVLNRSNKGHYEWNQYHQALLTNKDALNFIKQYGVNDDTISELKLGFIGKGISFPVFVGDNLVDVRTYSPTQTPKVRSVLGAITGLVIPEKAFSKQNIILVEGEKDMAVLRSKGINGATIIGGANALPNKMPSQFDGKNVWVVYDNDTAGRKGSAKLAKYLLDNTEVKDVFIVDISKLIEKEKGDITDYFMDGGDKATFIKALHHTDSNYTLRHINRYANGVIENKLTKFADADKFTNQTLTSRVQVAATFDSSWTVPISAVCNSQTWTLDPNERPGDLVHIMDSGNDSKLANLICPDPGEKDLSIDPRRRTVFKLVVASTTGETIESGNPQVEHLAYIFDNQLQTGKEYEITYKLIPDPKRNNKSTVIITKAEDLSKRNFELKLTDNIKQSLDEVNKYSFEELIEGQKYHIKANFNNKLIEVIDLAYHSVLNFNFGTAKTVKGTIDATIITDTGFGKSVTSQALLNVYGRGARVSLAGSAATPTGLIGGSKAIGNNYQTTAGVIPRNHKGIVIFEELAKNNGSLMKDLTDIRTSGVAEITRVSGKITLPANIRSVFFSNPKADSSGNNKTVDAYPNGVEVVSELLGAKEDVGRFDLIAVLGQRESIETNPLWQPNKLLEVQTLRDRLSWVWTRSADQVVFNDDAKEYLLSVAKDLNVLFETDEQLFGRKTWMKLAKVAIAIAGYCGSHSEDYESIVVTKDYIIKAKELFIKLYGSDTFKLDKYALVERSYIHPDEVSTSILSRIYKGDNQVVQQLESVSEIQTNELRTVSGLTGDAFTQVISDLTMARLIRNIRGKIIPTEKFRKTVEIVKKELPLVPPTVEERKLNGHI